MSPKSSSLSLVLALAGSSLAGWTSLGLADGPGGYEWFIDEASPIVLADNIPGCDAWIRRVATEETTDAHSTVWHVSFAHRVYRIGQSTAFDASGSVLTTIDEGGRWTLTAPGSMIRSAEEACFSSAH